MWGWARSAVSGPCPWQAPRCWDPPRLWVAGWRGLQRSRPLLSQGSPHTPPPGPALLDLAAFSNFGSRA